MNKCTGFESFKKYEVQAESLRQFCDLYHRQKYEGDQARSDYDAHAAEMRAFGFTFIPSHDSVTGDIVSYYGEIE